MEKITVFLEGGPYNGYRYHIDENLEVLRVGYPDESYIYTKAPSRFRVANDGDYQVYTYTGRA